MEQGGLERLPGTLVDADELSVCCISGSNGLNSELLPAQAHLSSVFVFYDFVCLCLSYFSDDAWHWLLQQLAGSSKSCVWFAVAGTLDPGRTAIAPSDSSKG